MSEEIANFFHTAWESVHAAAGSLTVQESVGRMSDFSGNGFSIQGDKTMASNGLIRSEMIDVMCGLARR